MYFRGRNRSVGTFPDKEYAVRVHRTLESLLLKHKGKNLEAEKADRIFKKAKTAVKKMLDEE